MRILVIGDIVGTGGVDYLKNHLDSIKKYNKIDMVIANAENSTPVGKGINKATARALYNCGVDIMTMGNHTFDNYEIYDLFNDDFPVIRPANLPPQAEGPGHMIIDINGYKVCVINLLGRVYLNNSDCPFRTADRLIDSLKSEADIFIVDFHAEATSEKLAMGFFLDGKASLVFGTHTHIQTADERILEQGTGYITDIGMTGDMNSILGVKKEIIIKKFLTAIPQRHEISNEAVTLNGIVVEIDETTKKCTKIERIQIS